MEDNIIAIVRKNILENNLIKKGDKVVVAVSGGPDSMCLLDVLYKLKDEIEFDIIIAHMNHSIREESEQEKVYVQDYAKKRNIQFEYLKVDVPKLSKENKMSEETYGRKARYEFFEKVRKNYDAQSIAVAHNLDDNIETILLNEIRGSGLKGLIGMDFKYNYIIRPILTIEKKDILVYNDDLKLNPCHDRTNDLNIYQRNKVRHDLIPYLKTLNPNFIANMTRMRGLLKEDNEFIENYANKIFKNTIVSEDDSKIVFNYSTFINEHSSITSRIIRKIIEKKLSNLDGIESIHILDITKLLKNNIKGKKYIIGNKFTIEILKKNIAVIY